jgi:hypothetical protein
MARSAIEHLDWAIQRALERYRDVAPDSWLPSEAVVNFLDDIGKHPRTAFIASYPHVLEILEAAYRQGREAFEVRMRGWSVRD